MTTVDCNGLHCISMDSNGLQWIAMDCRVGDEKREEALWLTLIAIWGWLGIAHTGLVWVALQHCDTVITLYNSESVTL